MESSAGVPEYEQFLLFGDSITQLSNDQKLGFGFSAALQNAYARRLDVINRGFSGYTTAHAIKVLPKFFPPPQRARIRFMTIFFGANDAVLPPYAQHVPLSQYKENLKAIVEHPMVRAQNPKIIILTPPPINEYQLEIFDAEKGFPTPSRAASNTRLYADACREVANSLGIPVVDIWTAFMKAAGWQEGQPLAGSKDIPRNDILEGLFTDGLHFSGEGYKIMFDEVMKVIQATWPDQVPERLPMIFPGWEVAPK
ncbi:hypothetical protein VTN77DRAFT_6188 [Rasamsonia byssochlamydoides]|uniref:uncharacterized protein n=1 Tax=Rasamsonia byssochlamydoides TaxID=89139 RepID=UPI00374202F7